MGESVTKEPFLFEWYQPTSDWYRTVNVEIKPDDYLYFGIERRFGPSWWLKGMNVKNETHRHWENEVIGQITDYDLHRFIEWAKQGRGSKIIEVRAISGDFNIVSEISKLTTKE